MVIIQSLIASCITVCLTEICKFSLLKTTGDPQKTILYSSIFSYSISYIAQRYVFNVILKKNTSTTNKNISISISSLFFNLSLLKYLAVSLISVQLFSKLLSILLNISFIKNIINNPDITPSRKRLYQYILINISIFIVFLCVDFPMRKLFIFANYTDNDYKYLYILFFIGLMIYLYTHTKHAEHI